MTRLGKRNLMLLVVLAVLGGAAWIVEKPFAGRSDKYATYGRLFPNFEPQKVRELLIRRGENEVTVRHTQTGWIVPDLYNHPADFQKVQEVAARVNQWKNGVLAGSSSIKHEKMAVGEETGTFVALRDINGEALAEFYVGRMGGVDTKRLGPGGKIDPEAITFYVRPLPGDSIYLINEFLLGTFTHQAENWAYKKVFDYPQDDVIRFVAEAGGETLTITRGEEEPKEWRVEGLEFPVDQTAVTQAVNAAAYIAASNIEDPEAPLEVYGLDSPEKTVAVTLKDGREFKLLVGNDKDERMAYGKAEKNPYPMVFSKATLDRIFQKREELVEKGLFSFSAWQATKITLEHPEETVVLEKDEDGRQWLITSPEGVKADRRVISGAVSGLGRLRHDGYVEKATDPAKYGLDSPTFKAVAEMEEETHTLLVGTTDEEGRHFAMKGGGEWVVLLSEETLALIRKTAEGLRERTPEEKAAEEEARKKAAEEKEAAEAAAGEGEEAPEGPDPKPEPTEEETPVEEPPTDDGEASDEPAPEEEPPPAEESEEEGGSDDPPEEEDSSEETGGEPPPEDDPQF